MIILAYFCGKHKFQTNDAQIYNIHIIDDHDTEHGIWQPVGENRWTKDGKPYYGRFRYLPMYFERNCAMNYHKLGVDLLSEYKIGN